MLTIRTEQLRALGGVSLQAFEDQLVEHCRGFAPRLYALRGEPTLRRVVRSGMQRAREIGFMRRGPTRFWIELMLAFGHAFDTDPQLAWAAAALHGEAQDELQRAAAVFAAMQDYQHLVDGEGKAAALAALRRVAATPWADLVGDGGLPFEPQALQAMQLVYPEKAAAVGADALRRIVSLAEAAAARHDIQHPAGRALIAGLMFGFGHGVLDDPLYPWVAATLQSGRHGSGDQRAERLAAKTRIYVEAMAAHYADGATAPAS